MKYNSLLFLVCLFALTSSCSNAEDASDAAKNNVNANLILSHTAVVSNWISLYDDKTEFSYSSTIPWSGITSDIRDHGVVTAYLRSSSSPEWIALPCGNDGEEDSDVFSFSFNTGIANIVYDGYDHRYGSPGPRALNGRFIIRLIAVPPAVRIANPDVNWNDYKQVRALLREQQPDEKWNNEKHLAIAP